MDHKIKENADVSLHDCRTNRVIFENHFATFYFPSGFYYIEDGIVPEDCAAEMKCHLIDQYSDAFSAYIYRKNIFGHVIREDWTDKFADAINNGKFEFEFVLAYRAYQFILFKGYVWFDKKPYHMECEIELHTDEITYSRSEK